MGMGGCRQCESMANRNTWLREQLGDLLTRVASTVKLLDGESEHKTMSRGRLLDQVWSRLRNALSDCEVKLR